jgi:hypothetical protein
LFVFCRLVAVLLGREHGVLPSVRGGKRAACPSRICASVIPAEIRGPAADDIASDEARQSLAYSGKIAFEALRTLSCSGPRFGFSSTIHVNKSFGP